PDPDTGPGDCSPRRPYSVLLPVGFAVPLRLPATRCALTAPFHPCRGRSRGGPFSVALSLRSRRLRDDSPADVIRHRMSMEPGLSSPATFRSLPERPSGRLTCSGMGPRACDVKTCGGRAATALLKRLRRPAQMIGTDLAASLRRTLVPRTRSSHEFSAGTIANFGFKSGTSIIILASVLSIPKFAQSSLQMLANFGIGTLAARNVPGGQSDGERLRG